MLPRRISGCKANVNKQNFPLQIYKCFRSSNGSGSNFWGNVYQPAIYLWWLRNVQQFAGECKANEIHFIFSNNILGNVFKRRANDKMRNAIRKYIVTKIFQFKWQIKWEFIFIFWLIRWIQCLCECEEKWFSNVSVEINHIQIEKGVFTRTDEGACMSLDLVGFLAHFDSQLCANYGRILIFFIYSFSCGSMFQRN